jgi:hypothetical protein
MGTKAVYWNSKPKIKIKTTVVLFVAIGLGDVFVRDLLG